MRSAFGLSGQKCSATSRVYVEHEVADALTAKLLREDRQAIKIGDPTVREHWLGPVISTGAVAKSSSTRPSSAAPAGGS